MKNLGFKLRPMLSVALAMCLVASVTPAAAQFVIIGIDNKVFWDSDAKQVLSRLERTRSPFWISATA